jgi:HSP20 family molecular chaperone IbpA
MMSFYPRSFYTPVSAEASFVPLFRLLDDFDSYSRQVEAAQAAHSCAQRRQCARQQPRQQPRAQRGPTFNPRFDVRENEDSYELHGELAGLERENVNVEFTDHETLVIRGRVERSYGQEAEKAPEAAAVEAAPEAAPSETTETTTTEEPEKRRHSHQATVEDDPEDENTPSSSRASSPKPEVAKAAPETQEVAKPAPAEVQPQQQRRFKRWERSVGEFSRAFTFPAPVDHENVTATMNNGILSVTVPKAKKPVARRIQISF